MHSTEIQVCGRHNQRVAMNVKMRIHVMYKGKKSELNYTAKARFRRTSSSAAVTACFDERCSFQTVLERLNK